MNGLPSPLAASPEGPLARRGGEGKASGSEEPMARRGEGGIDLVVTPTLLLPHQGGGEFFRELDAPQLCCGVLHFVISPL